MAALNISPHVIVSGTIDKLYPKNVGGYAFEIGEAALLRVLDRMSIPYTVETKRLCRKDSQDISGSHRWV